MTFQATIGRLVPPVGTGVPGVNTWLCNLQGTTEAVPEVRVLSLRPQRAGTSPRKALPAPPAPPASSTDQPPHPGLVEEGSFLVTEHDRVAGKVQQTVPSSDGRVTFVLQSKPTGQGTAFFWDLTIDARVDSSLMVLVRGQQGLFEQVALVSNAVLTPAQVNAQTAQSVLAIIRPVPRLSVGLIQTPPPNLLPASYRGVKQGGGNAFGFGLNPNQSVDLQALLYRIFFLLDAPGTFDPIWDSQSGAVGPSPIAVFSSAELASRALQASPEVATADELWARQVSEMLLGVPYDSPTNSYDFGRGPNASRLGNLPFCGGSLGPNATNPVYGIPFACQQLATFGILSRGESTSKSEIGAGSMASIVVTGMTAGGQAGKWFVDSGGGAPAQISSKQAAGTQTNPDVLTAGPLQEDLTQFIALPDYAPGAVHLFSNASVAESVTAFDQVEAYLAQTPVDPKTHLLTGAVVTDAGSKFVPAFDAKGKPILVNGQQCRYLNRLSVANGTATASRVLCFPAPLDEERDNQGAAHIGFTLRVSNGKAQFLDTGGLNAPARQTSEIQQLFPLRKGLHGGTMDDAPGVICRSLASPFRGVGVFKKLTAPTALVTHVNTVLKRARPMGFARLYLLQNGTLQAAVPASGNLPPVQVKQILYASPLKPMWDSDSTQDPERSGADPLARNYSIARYAWSLRGLGNDLQAVWVIYVPIAPLSDTMISAGRGNAGAKTALPGQTRVVRGCLSRADGTVTFVGADLLAPLTRLEGRDKNAVGALSFTQAFAPVAGRIPSASGLAGYFQNG